MLDNCLNDLVRMTILSLKHCIIQTHTSTKIKSGIKITVLSSNIYLQNKKNTDKSQQ